jgi:uncharacterized metal-binding protein YceD (DUF177 family)
MIAEGKKPEGSHTELHRPVRVARIGPDGFDLVVEATAAECLALAERMLIPAVRGLTCGFRLLREGESVVVAQGRLHADVVQTCIVSAEDFDTTVDEEFRVRFVPAGDETDEPDPESDDEIPYEGDVLDLGDAAAEQLGLALDLYPRMPGATLPETEAEADPHPFAALAALRDRE